MSTVPITELNSKISFQNLPDSDAELLRGGCNSSNEKLNPSGKWLLAPFRLPFIPFPNFRPPRIPAPRVPWLFL
jgi:hypothetical protein